MNELGKVIDSIKLAHEFMLALERFIPQMQEAMRGIEAPARAVVALLDSQKVEKPVPVELHDIARV